MSFIKVKDPRKREELVKDFIETRKRIKDNFVARKVGESEYQTGLTKLFKPVTETQKATAKEITDAQKTTVEKITGELLPIREGIEELPTKLFKKVFPSIEFKTSDIINFGPLAVDSLLKAFTKKDIDKFYGIYAEDGKFKIGDKFITIEKDNIIINNIPFIGTPGFWELVTLKNPEKYEEDDLTNYQRLVILTNTAYRNNNPTQNYPKQSKGDKWKYIIKPIWEVIKKQKDEDDDPQPGTSGSGLKILPSDPNALIDRFDLLFSSQKAGHTGVRNEIISILDELKRQGVINVQDYKKLNSLIKK